MSNEECSQKNFQKKYIHRSMDPHNILYGNALLYPQAISIKNYIWLL